MTQKVHTTVWKYPTPSQKTPTHKHRRIERLKKPLAFDLLTILIFRVFRIYS